MTAKHNSKAQQQSMTAEYAKKAEYTWRCQISLQSLVLRAIISAAVMRWLRAKLLSPSPTVATVLGTHHRHAQLKGLS